MKRKLNARAVFRSMGVLASAVVMILVWAPWAEAAGNVQVSVQDGDLLIQGDGANNNIIITETGVAGRAGTTVKRRAARLHPGGRQR